MKRKDPLYEQNKYEHTSFPFEVYKIDKHSMHPHGRGFDNLHWHEEIQYTLAVKGSLTMQVNGQNYYLEEGEAIFINSQLLHVAKEMNEDGHYRSVNFNTKILSFVRGSMMDQKYVLPYVNDYLLPVFIFQKEIPWQNKILELLKEIDVIYERRDFFAWEYRISILLCEIWYLILTNVKAEQRGDVAHLKLKQERIQNMLTYIHENYAGQITIENIAHAAHISVSECTRRFREYTGLSPYEYLIQYRISESCTALIKTNQSVAWIAESVGFQDASYFIQTFKKRTGTTPFKYRNAHKEP